jgi:hypothetical protein
MVGYAADVNRVPPEARRTAGRDKLDRAIPAQFHCPACDAVLATYKLALLNLTVDFDGEDAHGWSSWSTTIGTTVVLTSGLVNRRAKHWSGLPAYGPGRRGGVGSGREGLRIRLPATVTCRCGAESRLMSWADTELAEAYDELRDERARQIFEEQEAEERRQSRDRERRVFREAVAERGQVHEPH